MERADRADGRVGCAPLKAGTELGETSSSLLAGSSFQAHLSLGTKMSHDTALLRCEALQLEDRHGSSKLAGWLASYPANRPIKRAFTLLS